MASDILKMSVCGKRYRFDMQKHPEYNDFLLAFSGHLGLASYLNDLTDEQFKEQIGRYASGLHPLPWDRHSRRRMHIALHEYRRRYGADINTLTFGYAQEAA